MKRAIVLIMLACGPDARGPDPAAAACVAHRAALELACVDAHDTRPTIDACLADVRARVTCAHRDGGTP